MCKHHWMLPNGWECYGLDWVIGTCKLCGDSRLFQNRLHYTKYDVYAAPINSKGLKSKWDKHERIPQMA